VVLLSHLALVPTIAGVDLIVGGLIDATQWYVLHSRYSISTDDLVQHLLTALQRIESLLQRIESLSTERHLAHVDLHATRHELTKSRKSMCRTEDSPAERFQSLLPWVAASL
jgi:hypothetical protein